MENTNNMDILVGLLYITVQICIYFLIFYAIVRLIKKVFRLKTSRWIWFLIVLVLLCGREEKNTNIKKEYIENENTIDTYIAIKYDKSTHGHVNIFSNATRDDIVSKKLVLISQKKYSKEIVPITTAIVTLNGFQELYIQTPKGEVEGFFVFLQRILGEGFYITKWIHIDGVFRILTQKQIQLLVKKDFVNMTIHEVISSEGYDRINGEYLVGKIYGLFSTKQSTINAINELLNNLDKNLQQTIGL